MLLRKLKGNFSSALVYLNKLEVLIKKIPSSHKEFIIRQEVRYFQGVCFFEEDLFYSAYRAFKDAGKYNNSSERANGCLQESVTTEFYRNSNHSSKDIEIEYHVIEKLSLNDLKENVCIKMFNESGELISESFIAYGEELIIYLPFGRYRCEVCYGEYWFGNKEYFGYKESVIYKELLNLNTDDEYHLEF